MDERRVQGQQVPLPPAVKPEVAAVGAWWGGHFLIWGLDDEANRVRTVNILKTESVAIHAETKSIVQKLDNRDKKEVSLASGTSKDEKKEQDLSAPTGEVLYLKSLRVIVPVETSGNFVFAGRDYLETNLSPGTHDIDFVADLGTELRADKITCRLTATATLTADRTASFSPKGRRAKKLY